LLVGVVSVFLAQPLAWQVEKLLTKRWPSGRSAVLVPNGVHWRDKTNELKFDLAHQINYWRWRFEVKGRRGGRVPTGHHCFALRLLQGDAELNMYAFVNPTQATALAEKYPFYELRRSRERVKVSLGGRDAIFLAAEHARWDTGAELEAADFEALLDHLAKQVAAFTTDTASSG
jgi:hypothetical protein